MSSRDTIGLIMTKYSEIHNIKERRKFAAEDLDAAQAKFGGIEREYEGKILELRGLEERLLSDLEAES